jgi:hypothetical protein
MKLTQSKQHGKITESEKGFGYWSARKSGWAAMKMLLYKSMNLTVISAYLRSTGSAFFPHSSPSATGTGAHAALQLLAPPPFSSRPNTLIKLM